MGYDGKTAYGRFKGKEPSALGVEFGEVVQFRTAIDKSNRHKADEYWYSGVFIGIETCTADNKCFNSKSFSKVQTHAGVKYEANGLEHCTNYVIKIKPTHLGVDIDSKIVHITTKMDENAAFFPEFRQTQRRVEIMVKHTE